MMSGKPARAGALALLFVLGPALTAAAGAERALTLEEAIALALEKNEDLAIERQALAIAEAGVLGAEGAYDPLLEVEGGWRRASDPVASAFSGAPEGALAPAAEAFETAAALVQLLPTGGVVGLSAAASRAESDGAFDLLSPAYGTRLGVELRQPLLRDRTVDAARLQLRVAAADRGRAAADLGRQVQATVAAVERAYWTLAALRREIAVRQETLELAEEQLSETRVRIESGISPETEVAQPVAELERRRGELLAAREAVARAENDLKLLILGDDDAELWLAGLVPVDDAAPELATVDRAAAMERAFDERPEVAAARAVVERRRAETAFARNGVKPALDAVVSYDRFGLAGSPNPAAAGLPGVPPEDSGLPSRLEGSLSRSLEVLGDGDFEDARVALVFSLPLGNRTARAAAMAAESAEVQAEAALARVRKGIRAEVLDAAAALETAGQRIESARAGREAARVQLDAERERFAVGLSTNFLVLTRQNDLERARLEEIAALTDYRTAATEMARATGTLLAERGIALDAP